MSTHLRHRLRWFLVAVAATGSSGSAVAQRASVVSPAALTEAAATIAPADLARTIGALAADSMRDRVTPSLALERAAQYVAAQFQHLGLEPTASLSSWIWHYPVPGQLPPNYASSHMFLISSPRPDGQPLFNESGKRIVRRERFSFATDVYFMTALGPPVVAAKSARGIFDIDRPGSDRAVIMAGRYTPATVPVADVRGQVVFYLPAPDADTATQRQILARLYEASAGVVVVRDQDSTEFAAALRQAREHPVRVVESFWRDSVGGRPSSWAVAVRTATVARQLEASGLDLAKLRTESTPVLQSLPQIQVWLNVISDTTASKKMAPVVLGTINGTDSLLKQEYLVFTAHLDVDSAAGDNAAGVVALLALARVFNESRARPRRSVLFLVTSGSGRGQGSWGSNAYLDIWNGGISPPPGDFAGVINLEQGARLGEPSDSITLDGLDDVLWPQAPSWIAAAHPELEVAVRDGGTVVRPSSDCFSFVLNGVPVVSLHTGVFANSAAPKEDDATRMTRLVKFAFYMGEAIANADRKLQWSPAGRTRLTAMQRP